MVRIVFTGGSGKAGRHVIPYLISKGHQVLNLDLIDFPDPSVPVYTLKADLTDSGQVWNAFTSLFSMSEYGLADTAAARQPGGHLGVPDVVIHFAAYARNMIVPDNETFRANTQATYNIVEAATKLGVKKIMVASSECTFGVCFGFGQPDYVELPLTEEYPIDPMDTYGLTKLVGEEIARSFARRFANAHNGKGVDIYALRIGNVVEPHEYAKNFPEYLLDLPIRKGNAWSYIDARDLGKICDLAIQKSGLGFQVSLDWMAAPVLHLTPCPFPRSSTQRARQPPRSSLHATSSRLSHPTRRSRPTWESTTRRCRTARSARCSGLPIRPSGSGTSR